MLLFREIVKFPSISKVSSYGQQQRMLYGVLVVLYISSFKEVGFYIFLYQFPLSNPEESCASTPDCYFEKYSFSALGKCAFITQCTIICA